VLAGLQLLAGAAQIDVLRRARLPVGSEVPRAVPFEIQKGPRRLALLSR
jgi:hypothetical protein